MDQQAGVSRRDFLSTSGALTAAALTASIGTRAFAQGAETIKIGLVGCGGRGNGAAANCLDADPAVKLVALGDLFPEQLPAARNAFKRYGARVDLPPERCFGGFDAYKQVIDAGIDLVLLCTPPGWRPLHIKYAVEKGKHVFFEKPCAVDPVGARSVLESAELAATKKLALVAGTLYRHAPCYREVVKRIHDGAIGRITGGQIYYNTGELWHRGTKPEWSEAEYQLRNWYYFAWLSGDFNVEQHVHNLDVLHWVMGGPPTKCVSVGGRQVRTDPKFGHIYDHFVTDYEYPNGVHIMSSCRQQNGTVGKNTNHYMGTTGQADPSSRLSDLDDKTVYSVPREISNPFVGYVIEHQDLIASIRKGEPLNEAKQQAESSLIGVMARMSAYTGKEVTWDFVTKKSKLDLWPEEWQGKAPFFGPMATPPIAVPGRTPLI